MNQLLFSLALVVLVSAQGPPPPASGTPRPNLISSNPGPAGPPAEPEVDLISDKANMPGSYNNSCVPRTGREWVCMVSVHEKLILTLNHESWC